jgi:hypothetical protein
MAQTRMSGVLRVAKAGFMGVVIAATVCSCTTTAKKNRLTVRPTRRQSYGFVAGHEQLGRSRHEIYPTVVQASEDMRVQLAVSNPGQGFLVFHGTRTPPIDLSLHPEYILTLEPGAYPFEIRQTRAATSTMLSGAIFVHNVTRTLSLATLGKTPDTLTFAADAVREAEQGKIAYYTLKFDESPVVSYFIGNRTDPFAGGAPTAQLDFSGNPGISELAINGKRQKSLVVVLPIFAYQEGRDAQNNRRTTTMPTEYKFQMKCGKYAYHGFLRLLAADEYTAFVKLDCRIPENLLEQARKGTVAQYTIRSMDGQDIAQMQLSQKD